TTRFSHQPACPRITAPNPLHALAPTFWVTGARKSSGAPATTSTCVFIQLPHPPPTAFTHSCTTRIIVAPLPGKTPATINRRIRAFFLGTGCSLRPCRRFPALIWFGAVVLAAHGTWAQQPIGLRTGFGSVTTPLSHSRPAAQFSSISQALIAPQ